MRAVFILKSMIPFVLLLLVLLIAFCLAPVFCRKLWQLVWAVVILHFLIVLIAPSDGGRWGGLALFMLICFDCGLWLFRRELSTLVRKEGEEGFAIRLGIISAPVAIAFLATFVLDVFLNG